MLKLPDSLIAALKEAETLHARGERKRQLQFIGKLMRDIDPEPIQEYLAQNPQTGAGTPRYGDVAEPHDRRG